MIRISDLWYQERFRTDSNNYEASNIEMKEMAKINLKWRGRKTKVFREELAPSLSSMAALTAVGQLYYPSGDLGA
jgi:hypothetical protein